MDAVRVFEAERPRLTRIAYRMLGTMADAEDVVQRAWLRFEANAEAVVDPAAWLTRTVSRLALDAMRAVKRRREDYVGPWLPEPPVEDDAIDEGAIDAALMVALERLTPLERAAFLLHDVFGVSFEEVGATLGRDPAACRQLATRARKHVEVDRPRFAVAPERHEALAFAFLAASRSGDTAALGALLAADVVMTQDGGGRRPASLRRLVGAEDVAGFFAALVGRYGTLTPAAATFVVLDGLPALVTREADGLLQTTALVVEGGRITAILVQRNPDKLERLERWRRLDGPAAGSA